MVKDVYQMFLQTELKLTKHFKLKEFLYSLTAKNKGINNCPHNYSYFSQLLENLQKVAEELEKIRSLHGHPIYVTSGYRCEQLNEVVGGHPFSLHKSGCAADITAMDFEKLVDDIEWLYTPFDSSVKVKDVTYYYDKDKKYVHIQLNKLPKLNSKCNGKIKKNS